MSVCCDYRLSGRMPVYADDFPTRYQNQEMFPEVKRITNRCSGCMYGSFPEISISARYFRPMLQRAKLFLISDTSRQLKKLSPNEIVEIAQKLNPRREE
jgi:hypothetical protein